jgi:hypothetical protein
MRILQCLAADNIYKADASSRDQNQRYESRREQYGL